MHVIPSKTTSFLRRCYHLWVVLTCSHKCVLSCFNIQLQRSPHLPVNDQTQNDQHVEEKKELVIVDSSDPEAAVGKEKTDSSRPPSGKC